MEEEMKEKEFEKKRLIITNAFINNLITLEDFLDEFYNLSLKYRSE